MLSEKMKQARHLFMELTVLQIKSLMAYSYSLSL